ncbi:hypothetical protein L210DRAFT_3551834 [Boletus edulis BED1]|uniref:Uncharacterized protein n=1 Tax=Boletus edulis BED1 TaxID=1328754 RepID=A0AAD4BMY1_BOLED|nr:hypothetical protein L210DRAFT_3551834 [Boletus edulis BED1]
MHLHVTMGWVGYSETTPHTCFDSTRTAGTQTPQSKRTPLKWGGGLLLCLHRPCKQFDPSTLEVVVKGLTPRSKAESSFHARRPLFMDIVRMDCQSGVSLGMPKKSVNPPPRAIWKHIDSHGQVWDETWMERLQGRAWHVRVLPSCANKRQLKVECSGREIEHARGQRNVFSLAGIAICGVSMLWTVLGIPHFSNLWVTS